jgi:hypothetical protein
MNDVALDVDEEDTAATTPGRIQSKAEIRPFLTKPRRPMPARFALVCSTGGMSCLSAGKRYKRRFFCRLSLNRMNAAYLNSAFLLK